MKIRVARVHLGPETPGAQGRESSSDTYNMLSQKLNLGRGRWDYCPVPPVLLLAKGRPASLLLREVCVRPPEGVGCYLSCCCLADPRLSACFFGPGDPAATRTSQFHLLLPYQARPANHQVSAPLEGTCAFHSAWRPATRPQGYD